jgi:putative transport protein
MQQQLYSLGNGFFDILHSHASLMLFLIIGIGYLLGKIRFGSFSFGPVAGVLFASLFLGHFGFRITPGAMEVGFAMFIFSVGYQAGPRFFDVVKEDGVKYFILAVVVASTGFFVAIAGTSMMTLEPGTSAGVLAGGLTSSPTLAAAQDAVKHGMMKIPEGLSKDDVIGNISTGYAITYIFGLVGLISIIKLLPKWLGIDLVEEARRLAAEAEKDENDPVNPTSRCYRITNEAFTQPTVAELQEKYWDSITVVRVIRNGKRAHLADDDHLQIGDRLEMIGPRSFFIDVAREFGEEVTPHWNISQVTDTAQIIVLNKAVIGQTLGKIDIPRSFGLLLLHIRQLGIEIPHSDDLKLKQGDILTVVGPAGQIDKLGEYLGQIERDISETDMVTFAFGIVAGVLVGMLSVEIGGISIGLGSAGGLLAAGLIIGYLRSHRPTFGRLPDAAQWILMELGLLLFMAGVGLRAGGNIIETLQTAGPMLILAGIMVTCLPIFIGYWFGRKVLKIEPVILFGAITGAMTSGASLAVVTGAAKSPLPALGYTGTYAFANVLLMVAGSLILML